MSVPGGADVVVVGGGVIGVATARACAARGMSVVLCERDELAAGASGRNQGLLIGRCLPELEPIARASERMWLDLHERSGGAFALDREPGEYLVTSRRAAALDHDAALPGARRVSGEELRAIEPRLVDGLPGGVLLPGVRRLDPAAAVVALAAEARELGADLRTGCGVRELVTAGGGTVRGVLTDAGRIEAGTVVVAAGPWSWRVCRSLPFDVPVRGVRGWIAVTRPAPFRLAHVVEESREWWGTGLDELRVTVGDLAAAKPLARHHSVLLQQDRRGRVLLGSTMSTATGDRDEDEDALREICARAVDLVPDLADLEIVETRSCQRPASPDGLPLHGPVPGIEGLVLACGHGRQGVMHGPGSGDAVAEGLAGGEWSPAFLPDRFAATAAEDGRVPTSRSGS